MEKNLLTGNEERGENNMSDKMDMVLRPYKKMDAEFIANWFEDERAFRIISGNPRFFKCRDESVMCPFICENYIYIAGYGN